MQTGQPQEARSEQTDEQENRAGEGEESQEEEPDPVKYTVIKPVCKLLCAVCAISWRGTAFLSHRTECFEQVADSNISHFRGSETAKVVV